MKAKVTITVTRIIDLDEIPDYKGVPYEEQLSAEISWAEELPYEWMDADSAKWTTTGELIDDGPKAIETTESPSVSGGRIGKCEYCEMEDVELKEYDLGDGESAMGCVDEDRCKGQMNYNEWGPV